MIGLWVVSWAAAGITVDPPPKVGDETVIEVLDQREEPRAGETVRVVHRPGLSGERELAIGITDGRGRVRWTPEVPGVARLRAGDEPLPVQVQWAGPPPSVLMLLALVFLTGLGTLGYGVGIGARRG